MYGTDPEPLDTDQFDDLQIIARSAWGENRSLGRPGMQATINSAQNRLASGVRWWGHSLRTILLHPYQYSCWNALDPNRPKLMAITETDQEFKISLDLARSAIDGSLEDCVNGADSYVVSTIPKLPNWTHGLDPVAIIGITWFYRTVNSAVS